MNDQKITINQEQVKSFMGAVWPCQEEGFLAISTDGGNGNGLSTKFFSHPLKEDLLINALERWVPWNVWFSIGLFQNRPQSGRGAVSDVVGIPGLVADIDCLGGVHKTDPKLLPTKEEAMKLISEIPFKPSLIIWSGGGYQAHWLFSEPWIFESPEDREKASDISLRWQRFIVARGKEKGWKIDSVGSIEHLFRIPGMYNCKADPVPVEIVEKNDFTYSVDSIQSFLDDMPQEQPRQESGADGPGIGTVDILPFSIKHLIHNGAEKGSRSEATGSVLSAMLLKGVSEDEIFSTFESEKIGEKFREKGSGRRKWLEDEIGRARAFVGNTVGPVQWETPILLDDYTVPAFAVSLPGILGEMCEAVSKATETPIELGVAMALGTIATAIHGKMVVQVKPGHIEPTNLFIVAALDPSNRKSAVNMTMTKPLTMWEAGKRDLLSERIKQVESENKNKESRITTMRKKYGSAKTSEDAEKIQTEIFNLEMSIEEVPRVYRTWAQDITPEHLGVMIGMNGGRISIISAEGGIFEIIGGRYSNGVPNLDVFLQGYSGDPLRVDRGSRPSLFVESPALSMVLSPQPEVLRSIGEKKSFRGRGLLARFWYFIPVSNLGYRTLETEPIPEGVSNGWEGLIQTLLDIKPQTDDRNQIEPYVMKLDRAAYSEWFDFAMMVEVEMREGGRFEHITDWAGKLPGGAARVAGLLHCVKHPSQPWGAHIDAETMGTALELAAVASSHAEVAFNLMGADVAIEGAKRVWRWIEKGRYESFTKRDCFQALRGTFSRVSDLEIPLDVLEERNYISGATIKGGPKGGRPSIFYSVNPAIIKGWI